MGGCPAGGAASGKLSYEEPERRIPAEIQRIKFPTDSDKASGRKGEPFRQN